MRNRIKHVSSLMILAGAAALVGCASAQTTDEYATSHGYLRAELKGRQYFCRPQQTEVTSSDPGKVKWHCLTPVQVMQVRLAGSPSMPGFSSGGGSGYAIGASMGSSGAFSGTYQK